MFSKRLLGLTTTTGMTVVVAVTAALLVRADDKSPPSAQEKPAIRGYDNQVNRLLERRLEVKDSQGKLAFLVPESKTTEDVELKIVWTHAAQFGWNYSLPELYGSKNLLETEYSSEVLFLEKKLAAKTILTVSVPDTPYSFYILNGRVAPFFLDSKKMVVWHLSSAQLARKFREMNSISAFSKKIEFSAGGGDMVAILVVDFADRHNSPKIKYVEFYHGP